MIEKHIEEVYNNLPYHVKEDVGFPQAFIYLTTVQEQFIMGLLDNERKTIKEALVETLDEMRGLVDEI